MTLQASATRTFAFAVSLMGLRAGRSHDDRVFRRCGVGGVEAQSRPGCRGA
jgi:hypothetical protein